MDRRGTADGTVSGLQLGARISRRCPNRLARVVRRPWGTVSPNERRGIPPSCRNLRSYLGLHESLDARQTASSLRRQRRSRHTGIVKTIAAQIRFAAAPQIAQAHRLDPQEKPGQVDSKAFDKPPQGRAASRPVHFGKYLATKFSMSQGRGWRSNAGTRWRFQGSLTHFPENRDSLTWSATRLCIRSDRRQGQSQDRQRKLFWIDTLVENSVGPV